MLVCNENHLLYRYFYSWMYPPWLGWDSDEGEEADGLLGDEDEDEEGEKEKEDDVGNTKVSTGKAQ